MSPNSDSFSGLTQSIRISAEDSPENSPTLRSPSLPPVLLFRGASLRSNRRDSGLCACTHIPEQEDLSLYYVCHRKCLVSAMGNPLHILALPKGTKEFSLDLPHLKHGRTYKIYAQLSFRDLTDNSLIELTYHQDTSPPPF